MFRPASAGGRASIAPEKKRTCPRSRKRMEEKIMVVVPESEPMQGCHRLRVFKVERHDPVWCSSQRNGPCQNIDLQTMCQWQMPVNELPGFSSKLIIISFHPPRKPFRKLGQASVAEHQEEWRRQLQYLAMSAHIDIRHDELLASLDTANKFVDSKSFPVMLFREST